MPTTDTTYTDISQSDKRNGVNPEESIKSNLIQFRFKNRGAKTANMYDKNAMGINNIGGYEEEQQHENSF